MSNVAIRCEGLAKKYRVAGVRRSPYSTLRESIVNSAKGAVRALAGRQNSSANDEIFWALRDVGFEARHGDVIGVIGRNGAGKSTLLKILSRITEPTLGYADIEGRVGSMLEVGTGFHPELTGRENVYLNGAILGMSRGEVERKFDEIVDFAGVEKFIDTPVKHYSSGMHMRLAFAVAAHLETEILLVDEVLSVGDAQFQRKCLGKIGDVTRGGRTVLFVTHNMAAVRLLCTSALYLEAGTIKMRSSVEKVCDLYSTDVTTQAGGWKKLETRCAVVEAVDCYGENPGAPILPLQPAAVAVSVRLKLDCPDFSIRVVIEDHDGGRLLGVDSWKLQEAVPCSAMQETRVAVDFPSLPLAPGVYTVRVWLHSYSMDIWEEIPCMIPLTVHDGHIPGRSMSERSTYGVLAAPVSVRVF